RSPTTGTGTAGTACPSRSRRTASGWWSRPPTVPSPPGWSRCAPGSTDPPLPPPVLGSTIAHRSRFGQHVCSRGAVTQVTSGTACSDRFLRLGRPPAGCVTDFQPHLVPRQCLPEPQGPDTLWASSPRAASHEAATPSRAITEAPRGYLRTLVPRE